MSANAINTINHLINLVLQRLYFLDPNTQLVDSCFTIEQKTKLNGSHKVCSNYFLLLRVDKTFGCCCLEQRQLNDIDSEKLTGTTLAQLLEHPQLPVRIAALDAYFGVAFPHREQQTHRLELPLGTSATRAQARDQAIVRLTTIKPGQKVGLIGIEDTLVTEITKHGGLCLPCDLDKQQTGSGLPVSTDMGSVLAKAELIIATGMTLSNGTFDTILAKCKQREIPLIVYAQTGNAIIPRFLGQGVNAICAEPFPFSQFSAEPSIIHLYG